ncbi:hypothetical protein VZ95_20280 [Elstera litoralis]|uniref:Single Cache domain-containing protein n=1 Tax=Elstera litoralis TaxID=552518 RepID=A0A0F3ING9_9PROT|nr:hypothetical protein [Elstera litoralis]KJV07094.1 hypothetical protein VZ95_20280 [Elstera litoralis]
MFRLNAFARVASVALLAFAPHPVLAGTDFGNDEQLQKVVVELTTLVKEKGAAAAAEAIKNKTSPLSANPMGIVLYVNGKIAVHNKYPEIGGMELKQLQDLRGRFMEKEFTEAADKGGAYTQNFLAPLY